MAVLALCLATLAAVAFPRSAEAAPSRGFYGITPATKLSEQEYARIGNARVGTLRVPFFWQSIQPLNRHTYDWRPIDELVIDAARNGIRIEPFVMGVPEWLGGQDAHPYPPLSSRAKSAWRRLLTAMVERYGPEGVIWQILELYEPSTVALPIGTWQIWNEANARTYWEPGRTAPERYAKLLKISHRALAQADRGAKVIAAGLFEMPSDGMRMPPFVDRLYRAGAKRHFDALALHPYARVPGAVTDQIEVAREIMRRHGDRRKPIWITELGWPTDTVVGGGFFTKSEAGQARALERTFDRILSHRRRWKVKRLVWYTWRDNDRFLTCNLCRYSGLFRADLTPKPSWEAFVGFTGGSPDPPAPEPGMAEPAATPAAIGGAGPVPLTSARGR
jgi:polysaccharide biosynthesis protein PslG